MKSDIYSDWCRENTSIMTISGDQEDRVMAYWVEGVIVPTVGGIGLCGNICSICVLSKDQFRETFHKLLICLSILDSSFIICAVFTLLVRSHELLGGPASHILSPLFLISLPMGSFSLMSSMYLTISISVERYFGLCYPIQSRVKGRRRIWLYLIPVIFFSLLYNIPKFLEITPDGNLNSDFSNNLIYNKVYRQYGEVMVTVGIPLISLTILNYRIFSAVTNKEIRRSGTRQDKENTLAIILVSIVMVFFTCHSLKFFLVLYKVHVTSKTLYCYSLGLSPYHPKWMHPMSYINHLMLVLNSSINFIIYCLVGSRFRSSLSASVLSLRKYLSIPSKDTRTRANSQLSRTTDMTSLTRTPSIRTRAVHSSDKVEEYQDIEILQ